MARKNPEKKAKGGLQLHIGQNFWIVATAAVVAFTGWIVVRNLGHAYDMWTDIGELERERDTLQAQITRDSTLIEQLKYKEYLEKYAREHFGMQTPDEEVFIVEEK